MKKIFSILCLFISYAALSQTSTKKASVPPYVSNPNIPAFSIYQAPDSTVFTNKDLDAKKATLIMIFSPDCGHCQHETTLLLQNIAHFKDVQILMTTWLPFSDMMTFYRAFKIADYPQITMAWDSKVFFLPYYRVQNYPELVVYNKKGKFVKSFGGNIKLQDVWEALSN